MVNPGGARGFNPGEAAQPADAGNLNAADLSPAAKGNAEAQLGEGRKALDSTQTAESTVGKFQLESGLFKSGGLNPQEFRRSTDRANGVTTVENRMATFETRDGSRSGIVHTGKDGTVLTTREGERYGVSKGPDGRTVLTNAETGASQEVLSTRSTLKSINRPTSDIGPAQVHRQDRPQSEIIRAQQKARAAREGRQGRSDRVERQEGRQRTDKPQKPSGDRPSPGQRIQERQVRAQEGESTGRQSERQRSRGGEAEAGGKFNRSEFRDTLKRFESNPHDQRAQNEIKNALKNHPEQATKMMQKMAQKGDSATSQAKGSEVSNPQEALKSPEIIKSMQKAIEQANQGKPQQLDAMTKQMGLDLNNPQTKQFMTELGQRLKSFNPQEQGNVKVQDILKGLDPQSAKSLESFLTQGKANGGELTLNQLDQGRFKALQTLLDGQLGKSLDPATFKSANLNQVLKQIQAKPLNLEQPTGKVFGQNLQEIGQQLKIAEGNQSFRLSDLTAKSFDGANANQTGLKAANELIAKLSPGQEQTLRTLIENSKSLSNLIETGKINLVKGMEQGPMRLDAGQNILSDLVTRLPGSMQGNNFVVRGEVLGSLAAIEAGQQFIRGDAAAAQGANIVTRPDGSQVMMSPIEILSGKPIDPVTGLPFDPHTGKLLDPTTGRIIGQVRPGEASTTLSDKWDSSKKSGDKSDYEQEEAERNKKKMMLLADKARKLKELKERELREKAEKEKKRRQEDKKRTKYVVKEGDTLESIAKKQLRDVRLALLIYNINKNVLPVTTEGGKEIVSLRPGLVIWLPSPLESKEFRGQLMSGKIKPGTTNNITGSSKTYASAEEELADKLGENWSGDDTSGDGGKSAADTMLDNAVKESKKRRENIESVLGPIAKSKEKPKDKTGRQIYVVRLGESLKSIAMKHPHVRDVTLWKLIAEINKLSTLTDSKGTPNAKLTRGSKIKIPTREEIEAYRERTGVSKALSSDVEKISQKLSEKSSELHICDRCGRMSALTAEICGCGKRISSTKTKSKKDKSTQGASTGEVVKKAARMVDTKSTAEEVAKEIEENPIQPTEESPVAEVKEERFDEVSQLDDITRLTKLNSTDSSPIVYSLQVNHNNSWTSLLSYEIGKSRTLRHDDFSGGTRKTVKIDLPSRASEELAKNDLSGNWKNYKRKFLRTTEA